MNDTLKNLTKLRICGMLSEAARLEVERKILVKPKSEVSETTSEISFS